MRLLEKKVSNALLWLSHIFAMTILVFYDCRAGVFLQYYQLIVIVFCVLKASSLIKTMLFLQQEGVDVVINFKIKKTNMDGVEFGEFICAKCQ